jgi:hypothetical protein
LTLVAGSITVQRNSCVLVSIVLMCESKTSTNWNLSSNNTVSTVEALGEHVHRPSLAIGNTLSATKKFTYDGFHRSTTHESETVTSVGGNEIVFFGE